jgi:hypothetical protein
MRSPLTDSDLIQMREGWKNNEDIADQISLLGFQHIRDVKSKTADYVFLNTLVNSEFPRYYISYTTGYVRSVTKTRRWFNHKRIDPTMTPINRELFSDQRDRLLIILRNVLKKVKYSGDVSFFEAWKKTQLNLPDFLQEYRGKIIGNKFGF